MMPTRRQMICDEELRLRNGKENSAGRGFPRTSEILCPESTSSAVAIFEQPELRAYKLGKQKCSYNQVELVIQDLSGGKVTELRVSEAIETVVGSEVEEQLRESCLKFHVRFVNNFRIQLYIYVVYAIPYGTTRPDKNTILYHWMPVTRSKCRKGCTGSVIRGLQRFGRMPRRGAAAVDGEDTWKEPRHLYIAIDEASTHVCPRHETSKFRLLVAAYDDKHQLLGTTVSSSIRVLANNDAPLGAASFKLHCNLKGVTGSSPLRSSRAQMSDHPISVQYRLPLQALPPNTSPSRSKAPATEEVPKNEPPLFTDSMLLLPSTRKESRQISRKQVVAARSDEQWKNALKGLHGDVNDHLVANVTDRVLEACSLKPVESIISLRILAKDLGSKREVLAGIFSVLQSVGVVHQCDKEKFIWLGSSNVIFTLTRLSKEVKQNARKKPMATGAGTRFDFNTSLLEQPTFRPTGGSTSESQAMDNSMCSLSKRLIRLFLMDVTAPVSWDQVLTIFLDNHQEKDYKDNFLTGRRLLDSLRILGTLHLIRRCLTRRCSQSATYQWLGGEAVTNRLNSLSGNCLEFTTGSTTLQKVVCSPSHFLRSSRYAIARRRKSFGTESHCSFHHDANTKNSIQRSQQLVESVATQKQFENKIEIPRRSKRRLAITDEVESEQFSAVCQQETTRKNLSVQTSIPKKPRLTVPSSKVTNNFIISQGDDVACEIQRYPFQTRSSSGCLSAAGPDQVAAKISRQNGQSAPIMSDSVLRRCDVEALSKTGWETRFELLNANDLDVRSEATSSQYGVENFLLNTTEHFGSAGPSVFQFPYKKRPHNWSSYLAVAAPGCFEQPISMEHAHSGFFVDVNNRSPLPCFRPLYYLQQLLTPQQVEHVTAQNPAFLFHYVHYFRVLYHKLSAQATQKGATIDQAVVRPVAEHGAVEMPCQLHERESNGSASPTLVPAPTLHQLLIPFSRGGPWLKKESMTDPNSHHTRCHSPVSTHHVDHPTTEELLER
ncbi:uncharacterized protein [Physcomitrium patens]|uniref:uncharacterized protein isoform X2 n=1 Tax=Physcomitrium patens TaxID=3218 RepID=UPI003CCCA6C6